jgi:branched-chain amino acid transport system ATP-binding protein
VPPRLELIKFTGGHSGAPAVREVDLHVEAGEVVALLGPNGAGKTTTLLTVSGLLPVIAGDILIEGQSVQGRRPHQIARTAVAHVTDDRSLFFRLTVRQNLALGARGRRAADIDRVLALFPALDGLMDRKAGLLSGGEQQMLALGRALVSEPRLLLVDELSMGLAPVVVESVLPSLRAIADEGVAVLMVEQYAQLAMEIADRAYVLAHGQLVLEGAASDLANNMELIEASYMGEVG